MIANDPETMRLNAVVSGCEMTLRRSSGFGRSLLYLSNRMEANRSCPTRFRVNRFRHSRDVA